MALAAATAAQAVSSGASCRETALDRIIEKYSPDPAGDTKVRPCLPFPAVWQLAATTVPCFAPSRTSALQVLLVEGSSG